MIVSTIPWCCDFKDGCEQGWHLSNYWLQEDGTYTVDNYGDGDHEPVDDVPTADEEIAAWKSYYRYVAETGLDPVHQFTIPKPRTRKARWQASLRNWIGSKENGLRVIGVRRRSRGRFFGLEHAPQCVLDYLFGGHPGYEYGKRDLRGCKSSIGPEIQTFEKLRELCGTNAHIFRGVKDQYITLQFEVDEPCGKEWSEKKVENYARACAKRALREKYT